MGMIWESRFVNGIWNVAKFANDEKELFKAYDGIIKIYEGCNSYNDFYERTKEIMQPAHANSIFFSRKISKIVDFVLNGIGKKKVKLWCYQQAILIAAGIKAMHSQWNEKRKAYVAKEKFEFRFYVGRKERSHVELVIYQWKGKKTKISMDTHLEDKPFEWKGGARYLNSVVETIKAKV